MKRERRYLIERYRYMLDYMSMLLVIIGAVMLFPICVAIFSPEEITRIPVFLYTGGLLAGIGFILNRTCRVREKQALDFNESSLVVFLSWLIMCITGALPYMVISGMSFSHAVFDSVSGFTTTGLSLLDVPNAPVIILFYRAWSQFIGGAGFAIIMLASLTGVGAQNLYSAEGKGTLIKPNVLASARIVISLYCSYMIIGIAAYTIWGMKPLDAIVYCFAAISTGGFANHIQSIGYFDSPTVEIITIILMLLGNLSFLTGYFIVKGQFKSILRNGEVKVLFTALLISIPIVFFSVTSHLFPSSSKALRVAVFETISAITSTGFSTVDYTRPLWFDSGIFVMIVLQLIGGGTCSTAGGIKQYRIYVVYKSILWHIKSSLLPSKAVTRNYIWEGDQKGYMTDTKIKGIASFVFSYLALYAIGVMIITLATNPATGLPYSLRDAMFEFASSLGTIGLTIGVTTVHTPLYVIWTETIGMLMGRLEIFVVVIAIAKLLKDSVRTIHGS